MITGRRALASISPASCSASVSAPGSETLRNVPVYVAGHPRHRHHIARHFQVDGPLVPFRRVQHAVDLREGRLRVVEHRAGHRQLAKNLHLGIELVHAVMQQRVALTLLQPGRAADHHHRRALGERLRRGIGHLQTPHRIGDAHRPQPRHPRIPIRRKSRPLLVAGIAKLDRPAPHLLDQRERIIARNPEDMADAMVGQLLHQILPIVHPVTPYVFHAHTQYGFH